MRVFNAAEYLQREWQWVLLLTFALAVAGWTLYLGERDREGTMLESAIEEAIIDYAKSTGWVVRKAHWPGRRGAPDRVFMKAPGRILFLELKQPGKKPDALQERELKLLRRLGFTAAWVDTLQKAKVYLDE